MENRAASTATFNRFLRESVAVALPCVLAAGVLLILPADSRSQGDALADPRKADSEPSCGEWHRGSGLTSPLDTRLIRRAYRDLAQRVATSLDQSREQAAQELEKAYDAGLPSCKGEAVRTEPIPAAKGSRIARRTFYFLSASDPARLELPRELGGAPEAEILIVRARHLSDLPEITRRLGRPVSLGTADFAKTLGVRCANTWVKVSEKGDAVELHEAR